MGNVMVQELEVKNQSNCSHKGSSLILLQVYLQFLIGSSTRFCILINSLKVSISSTSPPGLFLLSGDRMKLKSPIKSQFSLSGIFKFMSPSVYMTRSCPSQGP